MNTAFLIIDSILCALLTLFCIMEERENKHLRQLRVQGDKSVTLLLEILSNVLAKGEKNDG